MRAREKRQDAISQNAANIKAVEEGRRRIELAKCVWSGDKEDELEKHATSYTDR